MSKAYNFFLDIDGTILPRGQKSISKELEAALEYARSKGCKIFINTGRTKAFVPYSLITASCFDGFCCGCGTYVEFGGKTVFEHFLSNEDLIRIAEGFLQYIPNDDLIFEGKDRMYYIGTPMPWFAEHGFIPVKDPTYFKEVGFKTNVHKFSTHTKAENRGDFFASLADKFDTMVFPHYCETVPLGFDKGNAIRITEEHLGLDPALSVAVGDSLNDAAMLKYAALSVAMGNATDEVKAMCDQITDTVDNDGVAKLIYNLVK